MLLHLTLSLLMKKNSRRQNRMKYYRGQSIKACTLISLNSVQLFNQKKSALKISVKNIMKWKKSKLGFRYQILFVMMNIYIEKW